MKSLGNIIITFLSAIGLASQSSAAEPVKSGAEIMQALRLRALSTPAKDFGIGPTKEHSRTYAVLIDFPIDQVTATIVSFSDGNASLYTTSTFGVMGGIGHEKVKVAEMNLVTASDKYFDDAKPIDEFPYPGQGKVRFYLVSFTGVRFIESSLSEIESNKDKYSSLFWLGQEVLTNLRLATSKN